MSQAQEQTDLESPVGCSWMGRDEFGVIGYSELLEPGERKGWKVVSWG